MPQLNRIALPGRAKEEAWHRRHAILVAAQLPEGIDDALIVLRLATQLVTGFLAELEKPVSALALVKGNECA
jgi:hypothetical protein